ncbi:hypothetical protein KMW28_10240 [Flammeovirga yaeyamensis]|uniref:Lipoprotein n=1 Tax=Flammeovirga yaeyamensis TaxID=367791 RepID=A0AAX1MXP1_9BACT|nr:hypothetical protein [Flammeovirga yaeyamensis]MBB3696468.1 hypothetical protein [Flammeovirga yaeyamensis]NMF35146.1 hypothetical protein [Flammeovirga yaeyamensis]QWG00034.1 hypothetical protein KMW28_10240 [Flammeovirga yaeyamensis]
MKKLTLKILILFSCVSCSNYESDIYINTEYEAINDILIELIKFKEVKRIKTRGDEKSKLYIISTLDTVTAQIFKPEGYLIGMDGFDITKEEIDHQKKEYETSLEYYYEEEKLFRKLKNGSIKEREIHHVFDNEYFDIRLIPLDEFKGFETDSEELGYLFISRIVFNKDYTKGYLHYSFACGIACFWDNNIEISKVNGKWMITKYFSGGIA